MGDVTTGDDLAAERPAAGVSARPAPGDVSKAGERDLPRACGPARSSLVRRRVRLHYGWTILAMCALAIFGVLGLARFGYTVVLPSMQSGLDLSNTLAGSLATANLLGYASLSLLGGALASHLGVRRVAPIGLLLAAGGMAFTGFAHGFLDAAAGRFVAGVGAGLTNVPAMALVAAWFAPRVRGVASGVAAGGSSLALILVGPLVPRILAATGPDGWRLVWWLYGAAAALLALAAYLLLRDRPAQLGLLPVGAGGPPPAGAGRPVPPSTEPTESGLHWGLVYRSRLVWHVGTVYVAFGLAYFMYMTFFTKHLLSAGYSSAEAGGLFMLLGWCSILSGIIWGGISDRMGRKWALTLVYLFHAAAFALFALWQTPAGFTLSAVIYGFCAWAIPTIMAALCGDVVGPRLAPAALGFVTFFFAVGQTFGPTIAGVLADATGSFAPAFLLASGVALLGAVAAALLPARPARGRAG